MIAMIENISLDELYDLQEKLFKLEMLTTDKDVSDKIYEVLHLVDEGIERKKKNAGTNQNYSPK